MQEVQTTTSHRFQNTLSLAAALGITTLLWLVFGWEQITDSSFYTWGIYPRELQGLRGVIFSLFIHGDLKHLLSNTLPMAVLTFFTFYFYPRIGWQSFLFVWLVGGLWTWMLGRSSYHIGASGVIYGLAVFLIFSGWFSKNYRLMAISLLVVFLYGSLFWGLFPIQQNISWEAHVAGAMAGFIAAVYYRKELPSREKYEWELSEDDEEDSTDDMYLHHPHTIHLNYQYKKKNNSNEDDNLMENGK
jgi:membrane associated rhomboid family serine protease